MPGDYFVEGGIVIIRWHGRRPLQGGQILKLREWVGGQAKMPKFVFYCIFIPLCPDFWAKCQKNAKNAKIFPRFSEKGGGGHNRSAFMLNLSFTFHMSLPSAKKYDMQN